MISAVDQWSVLSLDWIVFLDYNLREFITKRTLVDGDFILITFKFCNLLVRELTDFDFIGLFKFANK